MNVEYFLLGMMIIGIIAIIVSLFMPKKETIKIVEPNPPAKRTRKKPSTKKVGKKPVAESPTPPRRRTPKPKVEVVVEPEPPVESVPAPKPKRTRTKPIKQQ